MQRQIAFSWLLLAIYVALPISSQVEAYPYTRSRSLWNQFQEDYPEAAQEILDRIENLAVFSQPDNTKRNLDLGLTRSFSGGQSGKHMMGMTAANYGPGRRRRSEQTQTNN